MSAVKEFVKKVFEDMQMEAKAMEDMVEARLKQLREKSVPDWEKFKQTPEYGAEFIAMQEGVLLGMEYTISELKKGLPK